MFKAKSDRLKARTSIVVIHKSGEVEINCEHCRKGVLLPMQIDARFELKKAKVAHFVILDRSGSGAS